MPELDDLDRAFASLARDLAHSPGPGPAAAVSTARRRRRTRVGAVALAALVAVGGGLTVPQLLGPGQDGVAADGGSAPLDAAAMEQATEGWLDGWDLEARMGGSFSRPGCDALDATPLSTESGTTVLFIDDTSAAVRISGFPDATELGRSWDDQVAGLSACDGLGRPDEVPVDGANVLHWRVSLPGDGARTTDVWLARDGVRMGVLELVTAEQAAPADSVRGVAQALLAGVRDGWAESGIRQTTPRPLDVGRLPEWKDVDLEGALAGWRSASKVTPSSTPAIPCLDEQLYVDVEISGGGSTPNGLSYRTTLYEDDTAGPEKVAAMVAQFRACSRGDVRVETLPDGVHLATYDLGGTEGQGALWFAANGDRAGYVGMSRADTPMPESARLGVAAALHEILHLPRP